MEARICEGNGCCLSAGAVPTASQAQQEKRPLPGTKLTEQQKEWVAPTRAGKLTPRSWSNGAPVEDILWTDESYRAVDREAGLEAVQFLEPLPKGDEPCSWVSETKIAPWGIYVLRRVA